VTGAGLKELKALKSLPILRLGGTRVAGEDLLELAALPALGVVVGDDGLVTDATLRLRREHGLLHLPASETRPGGPARTLPWLNLVNRPITDAGLRELAGVGSLEKPYLGKSGVTDEGLKVLATLPALQTLRLNDTRATNAGLTELARVPTLREVALEDTRVSGAGLKALAGHKSLQTVGLAPRQSNNEAFRVLRENRMLHLLSAARTFAGARPRSEAEVASLILKQSGISDAGLRELAGLGSLVLLNLAGARVTGRAVEPLKKELPRLKKVIR
jgi:hypothetical protein